MGEGMIRNKRKILLEGLVEDINFHYVTKVFDVRRSLTKYTRRAAGQESSRPLENAISSLVKSPDPNSNPKENPSSF